MANKKNLTIFHTVSHIQWGGQERRVFNEARWMAQKGHRIIIAAPEGSPVFKKSEEEGWQVFPVAFKRLGIISDILKLRRILKTTGPDVFNTHGNMDAKTGLTAAWGLGIPCVILSRHITPPVSNTFYNRMLYGKLCHRVFTTSKTAARQVKKDLGVPADRIHFIPSGISPPSRFPDQETARTELAEKLGLPPETRFIGNVGRLSPDKGLAVLMDAFSLLKKTFPDFHLVFVGDGDMQPELIHQARQAGIDSAVHFMGFQQDPWPYYRAFECMPLVSLENEGVAQTLLEAMFAECPVIGSNIGGIPDVVIHRETGLIVPPNNAESIAKAIRTIISDSSLKQDMVKKAVSMVHSGYTIGTMGKKIVDLYNLTMSSH